MGIVDAVKQEVRQFDAAWLSQRSAPRTVDGFGPIHSGVSAEPQQEGEAIGDIFLDRNHQGRDPFCVNGVDVSATLNRRRNAFRFALMYEVVNHEVSWIGASRFQEGNGL